MKNLYKVFFISIIFYANLNAQIQYIEQASVLGCGNSTYGMGALGGGISFFDFDNDGWDDITVSSEEGLPVRFFKNNNGSFSEIDFGIVDELFETKTVQWVDFDNDGDFDLFITSNSDSNRLYENDGNMEFNDITNSAGLNITGYTFYGGSWGDYNNDGKLDLFVCSRNDGSTTTSNILYKNNGDGTFEDVNVIAGISTINHTSFCSAFFDFNNDGWQDIYVSNDKYDHENLLYKNNGDGTFIEVGAETGANIAIDAMSTTIGDYNNDGWLDIYVTNTMEGNVFLKNNGDETFTNIAADNGTLFESVSWSAVFLDADNDTDIDLYVSGMLDGTSGLLPSAFYENDGLGSYTIPVNAGFENDIAQSFSNAIGDINNDGYPDITVLNYTPDDIYLWKNECPQVNNWLKVKLQGVESNRQGVGSWIEISVDGQKQYNYTLCGEGFLGQNSAYEFFGIGTATTIDYIKVTWLSGTVDIINNPMINEHITIIEGGILSTEDNTQYNDEIRLYPNPGSVITISLSNKMENSVLSIIDMNGRILQHNILVSSMNSIDMRNYAKGIYIFSFKKNTIKIIKRVVIN